MLADMRRGFNLTQKQFGRALGLCQQTIANWEADRGSPMRYDLVVLTKLFEFWLDYPTGRDYARSVLLRCLEMEFSPPPNAKFSPMTASGGQFLLDSLFKKKKEVVSSVS